jgi:ATP-binding cassette, subfamily B, bacterial
VPPRFALLRTIDRYLRPYRWAFAGALGQVLVISAAELLKPWPLKIVVDNVLGGAPLARGPLGGLGPRALLLAACAGLVAIYAVLALLSVLNNATTIGIGQRMVNDFRRDLYQHLQRLSPRYYGGRDAGDLLYRVTADTLAIQTLSMNGVFPIIAAAVLLAGMVTIMLRLDPMLTVVALVVCPVIVLGIAVMGRRITRVAGEARRQESRLYSITQQGIAGVRVIQAFTAEEEEARRFTSSSAASLQAAWRLYRLQTAYGGVVNVIIAGGTALVLWVGASHVLAGALTIGEVLVFTTYLASLYAPINNVSQTIGVLQGARVGAQRVLEILATAPDLPDGSRAIDPARFRGEIVFERVAFGYTSERRVLRDVSFTAAPGRMVAIVGPTGAGKTTLVNLLARFLDPLAGRVLLDGVDLRQLRLRDLRGRIAMVLQPPLVFPTTLRENVAYGRPFATAAEIERAVRLARLDGLVARLPRGLDTPVGDQGAGLSEGERQRVTIARALVRDAPILILDEPTSALDAETEAELVHALRELARRRTTFVIAHRVSTIRAAEQILVLEDGVIVERGGFDELVARGGAFARVVAAQLGAPAARGGTG